MSGRPTGETQICAARPGDAAGVLDVQRRAFAAEALRYDDPTLPPLLETVEDVARAISAGQLLVARMDGRVVGSVRRVRTGLEVEVGRLSVDPQYQGRGIGSRLLIEAEAVAGATTASLFTGHLSEANLGLYRRLGYREFDRRRVSDRVELIYLRKTLASTSP